jgi:hypothetical protein
VFDFLKRRKPAKPKLIKRGIQWWAGTDIVEWPSGMLSYSNPVGSGLTAEAAYWDWVKQSDVEVAWYKYGIRL